MHTTTHVFLTSRTYVRRYFFHSDFFRLTCVLQLLGRAIKHLPRDQIIVATKVGKYIAGEPADFSAARVTKSVHESLERMQLKHIDLIQVHDIEFAEDMRQVRAYSEPFLIYLAEHFTACASGNQSLMSSDR
jgi:L-galactose dehydrogenase